MIVQTAISPNSNELIDILREQFPKYSVYNFDSTYDRSVIVRKSSTVGVQITVHGNEVNVDACCPNIFISALIGLLSTILPPYQKFEMKIADFLQKRYS